GICYKKGGAIGSSLWLSQETLALHEEAYLHDCRDGVFTSAYGYLPYPVSIAEWLRWRAEKVVAEAKAALAIYLSTKSPTRSDREQIARHACRLNRLESVYRRSDLEPEFESVDPKDVLDLLNLLAVVPFDLLIHDRVMILNPDFGMSDVCLAADGDLI